MLLISVREIFLCMLVRLIIVLLFLCNLMICVGIVRYILIFWLLIWDYWCCLVRWWRKLCCEMVGVGLVDGVVNGVGVVVGVMKIVVMVLCVIWCVVVILGKVLIGLISGVNWKGLIFGLFLVVNCRILLGRFI